MTQQAEPDAIPDEATTAKGAVERTDVEADAGTDPEPTAETIAEAVGEPAAEAVVRTDGPSRQEEKPDGFGAAFCASMATLSAEVVIAATSGLLVLLSREHDGLPHGVLLLAAVSLAALLLTVLLSGFVTAAAVMPALTLARRAARRTGRSGRWPWTAGAVAAVSAAGVITFGAVAALGSLSLANPLSYLIWWASLTVGLLPAAFVARIADRRVRAGRSGSMARRVTRDGAIAWLTIGALGAALYGTGLVAVYKPPKLHKSDLAGVWDDGRGGRVELSENGTAVANGLDNYLWDGTGQDKAKDCDGPGTWSPMKDGGKVQGVHLEIAKCGFNRNWSVAGTAKEPRIFYGVGKPGSGKRYELKKVVKGKGVSKAKVRADK